MIIDSHIHLGLPEFLLVDKIEFDYNLFNSYEDTIKMMDNNGIDRAIVFPIPHYQIDTIKSNAYILEACKKYPDRFIPFCRIDDNLEENLTSRLYKGVKLHLV